MAVLMVPVDKDPWPSLGGQVCDFIENYLVFGPGDLRGQPAFLDEEKRALIWRFYEVFPDDHEMAGRRRFKRAGISLRKGTAKTELLAWIAACELHPDAPVRTVSWHNGEPIGHGVTDPYIPLVAYTQEQSDELAYGTLMTVLQEGPLRNDFDIGLERIMRKGGDGRAVSLSSAPSARDGARTTFAGIDESHWWTSARLKQAHTTILANIPKRYLADAWSLEVTTAPEPGANSVAENTMQYAEQIEKGKIKDANLFYFHRQASDHHDLNTEKGARAAVLEASGPAAAWSDIDSIINLWRDPTTDRQFWERVWCNRLVKSGSKAFDILTWDKLAVKENPAKPGDQIVLGFDGSQFNDATGIVATHIETGYQWVVGAWEQPLNAEGWQVPAEEVDDLVDEMFEAYEVWRMYADPPYWQSWVALWAGRYGDDKVIEWWTNRRKQMSYALESFSTAIATKDISHGGDDRLRQHLSNSFKHELHHRDDEGKKLWLIRKERADSPNKIDVAMAAVLSWEARTDAIASGVLVSGSAGIMWI